MANILGFSNEHDSGVAFLKDGELIYAANEERFNREKLTFKKPVGALNAGEKMFPGFTANSEQNAIAIASRIHISKNMALWAGPETLAQKISFILSWARLDRWLFGTHFGARLTVALLWVLQIWRRIKLPGKYIEHHVAHAASAYYAAPFGEQPVFVITLDSQGDGFCSKAFIGKDGKLKLLHSIPFFHSPGHYYLYITLLLGFKAGQEGKVTGLAGYGRAERTLPIFQKRIIFDENKCSFINNGFYRWREINYLKKALTDYSHEDIAAGIQRHLENLVTAYIKALIKRFNGGEPIPLALAGGVFANVQLNKKIMELPEVSGVYIYPHMGDGGLAAGAAMALAVEKGAIQPKPLENLYLGPSFDGVEVENAIKNSRFKYLKYENSLGNSVAKLLAEGKVVAICRRRMEYGPRALGNRSILCQATDPKTNDWLNKKLRREEFMPFAPILRKEHLAEYFIGWEKCEKALEFMTIALDTTEKCKREASAIVHIDGTSRPQIVTREINPFIYDLLGEYEKLTGLKILINTSFNMHEKPIVCTPEDAIKAFRESKLDVLLLENHIVYAD